MVAASLWLFVYIKGYQAVLSLTHLMVLLFKRKQQIFFQSHIEECSDLCHVLDCQYGSLPNLQLRAVGGCNEAVLGILVYNTSRLSPTFVPSGTCFFGRSTEFLSSFFSPRYTPNSFSL